MSFEYPYQGYEKRRRQPGAVNIMIRAVPSEVVEVLDQAAFQRRQSRARYIWELLARHCEELARVQSEGGGA